MDLESILAEIQLKKLAPTRHIVGKCALLAGAHREHPAFSDEKYLPFYYYLGKAIQPHNILNLDFDLGIKDVCFLTNCKSVQNYTVVADYGGLILKFGKSNVKMVYKGDIEVYKDTLSAVKSNHWDVVFSDNVTVVSKWARDIWQKMNQDGLLVVGRSYNKSEIQLISELINQEPKYVPTRYGVNIFVK